MGRQKLAMEPIKSPAGRQVTYSKRRNGILKKAFELSVLCEVDIAIAMFSPAGKLAMFSRDDKLSIEGVIARFQSLPLQERMKKKTENFDFLDKLSTRLCKGQGLNFPKVGSEAIKLEAQEMKVDVEKLHMLREQARAQELLRAQDFHKEKSWINYEYIEGLRSKNELSKLKADMLKTLEVLDERLTQVDRAERVAREEKLNDVYGQVHGQAHGQVHLGFDGASSAVQQDGAHSTSGWAGYHQFDNHQLDSIAQRRLDHYVHGNGPPTSQRGHQVEETSVSSSSQNRFFSPPVQQQPLSHWVGHGQAQGQNSWQIPGQGQIPHWQASQTSLAWGQQQYGNG